jgi:hypothetical protein
MRLESSMLKCFKQFEKLRQNRKTNIDTYNQSVKTNPNNVGQASVLDSKSALTPKESSSNRNQNNEIGKTNPIALQIMTEETPNLLKIPA